MNKTAIMIVLDRSPSMAGRTTETIQGVNMFLQEQKKDPRPATLSLIQFSGAPQVDYIDKPLAEVEELTKTTYHCGGNGTALFDSVADGIKGLGERLDKLPRNERPDNVLFVIITDGEENASKRYTADQVRDMIRHQTDKYSWTFVFMGADIDAYSVGGNMGIDARNIAQYNKGRTADAYSGLSRSVARGRGVSGQSLKADGYFIPEDKKKIESST